MSGTGRVSPLAARHLRVRASWVAALAALGAAMPASAQAPARADALVRALEGADTLRVDTLTAGVVHAYAWDRRGPWAIHVLEVERDECVTLAARKAGPPIAARTTTSSLAAGAVAGVNADFFRIPDGTTVGAHVEGGEVIVSPGERPVFAVGRDGRPWIGEADLRGTATLGAKTLEIAIVNAESSTGGLALFDPWYGGPVTAGAGGFVLRVAREGRSRRGRVVAVTEHPAAVTAGDGTILFSGTAEARSRVGPLAPGATMRWHVDLYPEGDDRASAAAALEAVGGFPVLLARGRIASAIDETAPDFGQARHPRTAVGYGDGGTRVVLVTVDGRQAPYSDGMTLTELAETMLGLGAVDALNLDGGGSTTMAIAGRVANRPSDRSGERPVGNALLVRSRCAPE